MHRNSPEEAGGLAFTKFVINPKAGEVQELQVQGTG